LSYITRDFPIEFVNAIVHKEVQGKKPIYNLHRWWARRVGTTFRMMLPPRPHQHVQLQSHLRHPHRWLFALPKELKSDILCQRPNTSCVDSRKTFGERS
jgi:hypothetical protein